MKPPNKLSYYRLAWRQLLASLLARLVPPEERQEAVGEPRPPAVPLDRLNSDQQREEAVQEALLALKLELYRSLEPLLTQLPLARHAQALGNPLEAADVLALYAPLDAALQELGFESIGAVGEIRPFDPTCHQAAETALTPGRPIRVKQPGYRLGERMLRRARVVVSEI